MNTQFILLLLAKYQKIKRINIERMKTNLNYYQKILEEIKNYKPAKKVEIEYKKEIINFLINNKDNYLRSNPKGHLTASAWIINSAENKVLLHHHQSLDKWIQLGGHLENNELTKEAALREAKEESGLNSLSFLDENIFDIDVHKIPEYKNKDEHYHYDLRYILKADMREELNKSKESIRLKWIDLNKVTNYLNEESILRMVRKTNNKLS